MKKQIAFLTSLLIISTFGFSQNKACFSLSLGSSTPTGDFASVDADNEAAGFADAGAIFDLNFTYQLKPNFGLSLLLRGQANTMDNNAIENIFVDEFPGASFEVESGTWGIGGIMIGGFHSYIINDKLSFDSRAMVGFLNCTSPEMTILTSILGSAFWIKQHANTAKAFSFLIGTGAKYSIGKNMRLLLNLDYLGANPEFVDVKTTSSLASLEYETFSQSFGAINIGVGLGYSF